VTGDSGAGIDGPDTLKGALLYVLIGVAVMSYGGYDYVQQTEAVREAVEVEATVTDLGIETERGTASQRGVDYDPTVAFAYTYNGTEYTGSKIYPADIEHEYETRSGAESVIEEYEEGGRTTAYVTPDRPGDAFLKNETTTAPLIAIALGGIFALFATVSAVRKL
jgi:hypothetical protein